MSVITQPNTMSLFDSPAFRSINLVTAVKWSATLRHINRDHISNLIKAGQYEEAEELAKRETQYSLEQNYPSLVELDESTLVQFDRFYSAALPYACMEAGAIRSHFSSLIEYVWPIDLIPDLIVKYTQDSENTPVEHPHEFWKEFKEYSEVRFDLTCNNWNPNTPGELAVQRVNTVQICNVLFQEAWDALQCESSSALTEAEVDWQFDNLNQATAEISQHAREAEMALELSWNSTMGETEFWEYFDMYARTRLLTCFENAKIGLSEDEVT